MNPRGCARSRHRARASARRSSYHEHIPPRAAHTHVMQIDRRRVHRPRQRHQAPSQPRRIRSVDAGRPIGRVRSQGVETEQRPVELGSAGTPNSRVPPPGHNRDRGADGKHRSADEYEERAGHGQRCTQQSRSVDHPAPITRHSVRPCAPAGLQARSSKSSRRNAAKNKLIANAVSAVSCASTKSSSTTR